MTVSRASWRSLDTTQIGAFRAALAFLDRRLGEASTVGWALGLKETDRIERIAVVEAKSSPQNSTLAEPWATAWALIIESWGGEGADGEESVVAYDVNARLEAGERSGALISELADLVRPRLHVEAFSDLHLQFSPPPHRPRKVTDLFTASLTSGKFPEVVLAQIFQLTEVHFVRSLANELAAAVARGIDIARRIGWADDGSFWSLGGLARVYFVPADDRPSSEHEPDEFHQGIAPSVKLLFAAASRLSDIQPDLALGLIAGWSRGMSQVHTRLWAALARNPMLVQSDEVEAFVLGLDERMFWYVDEYPEIAELRARRFQVLSKEGQLAVLRRIRRMPPRSIWPRGANSIDVLGARRLWAARELRRIQLFGGQLRPADNRWLHAVIEEFPQLAEATTATGFPRQRKAQRAEAPSYEQADLLTGASRLALLEEALASGGDDWDDQPAGRANSWITAEGHPSLVLNDLEANHDHAGDFPRVWDRFGWAHTPEDNMSDHGKRSVARRVCGLIASLPEPTVEKSVGGLSNWLSRWAQVVSQVSLGAKAWFWVWPAAEAATNKETSQVDEFDLSTIARSNDAEPQDLDTLNTPAGKMVEVFLASCPRITKGKALFRRGTNLYRMRSALENSTGRSGLIVRHRLIEHLGYFMKADKAWANAFLIGPLSSPSEGNLPLWRAIGRRLQFRDVLRSIGREMANRTTDKRLGRRTRASLVSSLVVECLYAYVEGRRPVVPHASVQQALRLVEDEVRADAAQILQRFIVDNRKKGGDFSSDTLFLRSIVPFLTEVWPQEKSLQTPGTAKAFADIPSTVPNLFAQAVNIIEPLLVPFHSWSMIDYGLYGDLDGRAKMELIDTAAKADALLALLDGTIGTSEDAIAPHDLFKALDRIEQIAPTLATDRRFLRLRSKLRRG